MSCSNQPFVVDDGGSTDTVALPSVLHLSLKVLAVIFNHQAGSDTMPRKGSGILYKRFGKSSFSKDSNNKGFQNGALVIDNVEREIEERRQRKLQAAEEVRKTEGYAKILKLQQEYREQLEKQEKREREIGDEPINSSEDLDSEGWESEYPPTYNFHLNSKLSWVNSITSSLNSSFTSQTKLIADPTRSGGNSPGVDVLEMEVEGRIKTEQLMAKVNEALNAIKQNESTVYSREIMQDKEQQLTFATSQLETTFKKNPNLTSNLSLLRVDQDKELDASLSSMVDQSGIRIPYAVIQSRTELFKVTDQSKEGALNLVDQPQTAVSDLISLENSNDIVEFINNIIEESQQEVADSSLSPTSETEEENNTATPSVADSSLSPTSETEEENNTSTPSVTSSELQTLEQVMKDQKEIRETGDNSYISEGQGETAEGQVWGERMKSRQNNTKKESKKIKCCKIC
ncbi:hypothetical protein EB796_012487 [Bugula neritina]|uniref:Uncharacterized protein n=1 Tax=Bugula neritina TaxID=10212 RepID=A0A7J7JV72_BUGNE|nr:hypothetical protein EB796_012487 [Bugula neritina]